MKTFFLLSFLFSLQSFAYPACYNKDKSEVATFNGDKLMIYKLYDGKLSVDPIKEFELQGRVDFRYGDNYFIASQSDQTLDFNMTTKLRVLIVFNKKKDAVIDISSESCESIEYHLQFNSGVYNTNCSTIEKIFSKN